MPAVHVLCFSNPPQLMPCCLDYAKVRHGGSFHDSTVDEIKVVCKIVLVFASLVPYWIVYYQVCWITYLLAYLAFYISKGSTVTVWTSYLYILASCHSNVFSFAAVSVILLAFSPPRLVPVRCYVSTVYAMVPCLSQVHVHVLPSRTLYKTLDLQKCCDDDCCKSCHLRLTDDSLFYYTEHPPSYIRQ